MENRPGPRHFSRKPGEGGKNEDLLSHEEHLLEKTRPTHVGLRQTGEPMHLLDPGSMGHSQTGDESGEV